MAGLILFFDVKERLDIKLARGFSNQPLRSQNVILWKGVHSKPVSQALHLNFLRVTQHIKDHTKTPLGFLSFELNASFVAVSASTTFLLREISFKYYCSS